MSTEIQKKEHNNVQSIASANSESRSIMTLVERMATDKDIDPERVDRAFEMYKQVRSMEAEAQFNNAMALAQSEIQGVITNKTNTHTKSNYADLKAIHDAAKPIWTKYGLSVVSRTARSDIQNHIRVITDVRHAAGHKETHEDDWPLDNAGSQGKVNKTPIQAKGSTTSYARRYTELMVFDIATGDDDDGSPASTQRAGDMTLNEAQIKTIKDALTKAGKTEEEFCKTAQIEQLKDLHQKRLAGALKAIEGSNQ